MLPAERRDVLEQGRIDGLGFPKQSDGAFQVKRVPQRDGGDHQVKTAGAILLILEGTVADLAQPIEKYSLGEGVSGFALIEASRDAASQGWILQPGQREQRALDPADFAQGQSKAVLSGVSSQLPQNQRCRYRSLLDRGGQTQGLGELLLDQLVLNGAADQCAESGPLRRFSRNVETFVGQITDAWRETEPQQMAQRENVIGEARCVRVMFGDPQI